jgi:hypothetical protein
LAVISILVAGWRITTASSHEYIVKPATMRAAAGTALPIAAFSTHVFMVSQELEKSKDVKAGIVCRRQADRDSGQAKSGDAQL